MLHSLGMKVAAHAHGKAAIDAAIRLGVDSIEHSSFADAESFKLYKKYGTYLVPTLLVAHVGGELARTHPEMFNPSSAAKARSEEHTSELPSLMRISYAAFC